MKWLLVDDSSDERESFSKSLTDESLTIEPISATEAERLLEERALVGAGVLMDVDLSNETGIRNTGPGMAQSIRVAQHRRDLPSYPIVRFSLRRKVEENIGRDTSSDDLFDLRIDKDRVSDPGTADAIRKKLRATSSVYEALQQQQPPLDLLKITEDAWERWGHQSFLADLSRADRPHVAAGPVLAALTKPGLLIGADLLAARLGINADGLGSLTSRLKNFQYVGVASDAFTRWWARGLEEWWTDEFGFESPLSRLTINERCERLRQIESSIEPIKMPKGSPGERPWRFCQIHEEDDGTFVPVDPAEGVRLNDSPQYAWMDPPYASLGAAVRLRDDPRLDEEDLRRLQAKYRGEQV